MLKLLLMLLTNFIAHAEFLELNTPNFRIVFDEELKTSASELAEEIEEIARKMSKKLNIEIKHTNVFLLNSPVANGFVLTVIPENIYIYPNQINFTSGAIDSNVKYIFRHELFHSLLARNSIKIFGVNPLAVLTPNWLHEGGAVYFEGNDEFLIRGHDLLFINIPKSLSVLSLAKTKEHSYLNYSLGYSLLSHIAKIYGEKALLEYILSSTDIFPPTFRRLTNFYVLSWQKGHQKAKIIGEKIFKTPIYAIKGGLTLLASDHKYLLEISPTDFSIIKRFGDVPLYFSENGVIIKKFAKQFNAFEYFSGRNNDSATFINSKLINKENIIIALPHPEGNFYVISERGEHSLYQEENLIIKGLNFYELILVNDKVYFIAAERGKIPALYSLKPFLKITECGKHGSSFKNSIYITQNFNDQISILEYDTVEDKLYRLATANTLLNPVRIEDDLFFLQYDEALPYIYKLSYAELEKEELEFSKKRVNLRTFKKRVMFYNRYAPRFAFLAPILILSKEPEEDRNLSLLFTDGIDTLIEVRIKLWVDKLLGFRYKNNILDLLIYQDWNKNIILGKFAINNISYIKSFQTSLHQELIFHWNNEIKVDFNLSIKKSGIILESKNEYNISKSSFAPTLSLEIFDTKLSFLWKKASLEHKLKNRSAITLRIPIQHFTFVLEHEFYKKFDIFKLDTAGILLINNIEFSNVIGYATPEYIFISNMLSLSIAILDFLPLKFFVETFGALSIKEGTTASQVSFGFDLYTSRG